MRRFLISAVALAALTAATDVSAQGRGGGQPRDQEAERERRRQTQREFQGGQAPLDGQRNAGPCPYVKVLYDAARVVEFAGGGESPGAVSYAGEIQGVEADCTYREADPIRIDLDVLFTFGKGPQAKENARQFRWWVAVTERNRTVLTKEYFGVNAAFEQGQDRVAVRESLGEIVIPRATQKVAGDNFEVLVGFDVTPAQAAFNREGKRFRMTAGQTAQAGQTATR